MAYRMLTQKLGVVVWVEKTGARGGGGGIAVWGVESNGEKLRENCGEIEGKLRHHKQGARLHYVPPHHTSLLSISLSLKPMNESEKLPGNCGKLRRTAKNRGPQYSPSLPLQGHITEVRTTELLGNLVAPRGGGRCDQTLCSGEQLVVTAAGGVEGVLPEKVRNGVHCVLELGLQGRNDGRLEKPWQHLHGHFARIRLEDVPEPRDDLEGQTSRRQTDKRHCGGHRTFFDGEKKKLECPVVSHICTAPTDGT